MLRTAARRRGLARGTPSRRQPFCRVAAPCARGACGHRGARARGTRQSPASPCIPCGGPCRAGWGASGARCRAAGGTPSSARAGGSGAHRSASSSTAPQCTAGREGAGTGGRGVGSCITQHAAAHGEPCCSRRYVPGLPCPAHTLLHAPESACASPAAALCGSPAARQKWQLIPCTPAPQPPWRC